jgi:hypothetical protein
MQVTLTQPAESYLQFVDDDEEECKVVDAIKRLTVSAEELSEISGLSISDEGKQSLESELVQLSADWGDHYPVQMLLAANGTELETHVLLSNLEAGSSFQLDGDRGDGGSGTRKEFTILQGDAVTAVMAPAVDSIVLVQVSRSHDGTEGNVLPFLQSEVVRPVLEGRSIFWTKDEAENHYQQWVDYCEGSDKIDSRVATAIEESGQEQVLIYSASDSDERDVPIDNLDQVAVEGKVVFKQEHDPYWGEGKNYESPILENPTWLELTVHANRMMTTTNDLHHVFLEGVEFTGKVQDGSVAVYQFSTGS